MQIIYRLLPDSIRGELDEFFKHRSIKPQEIRLRVNRPVEINDGLRVYWLSKSRFSQIDAENFLSSISEHSIYRLEQELRQGYITIDGGHRIGITGRVNVENGRVRSIQHITSFNIRIAREQIGVSHSLIPVLWDNRWLNTLIIGPPQSGKTTLLRDMARVGATGSVNREATKVGIVDERSEIAASVNGIPQMQLGYRTDVLDRCPKSEGMMMLIRSMSPEIIVVDEIGGEKDVYAVEEAVRAGASLFCTIHGEDYQDIQTRPSMKRLMKNQVFDRYVIVKHRKIIEVLDSKGQAIHWHSVPSV
ncbi:stage III sporulation protein AA [Gracilibacillus halotolerans]|uniref:Stage III sporulation protein AA n=1 Tax=Gracilibacillus halotolerans TaxID=74386 RepID=A0A841RJE3_9BACI|nr:stage III sporulation protein AA [Gracilibacillus halotolerans]MBB6511763.1 stage III sporulation protein AA [Gracilibacillus halotolerans]